MSEIQEGKCFEFEYSNSSDEIFRRHVYVTSLPTQSSFTGWDFDRQTFRSFAYDFVSNVQEAGDSVYANCTDLPTFALNALNDSMESNGFEVWYDDMRDTLVGFKANSEEPSITMNVRGDYRYGVTIDFVPSEALPAASLCFKPATNLHDKPEILFNGIAVNPVGLAIGLGQWLHDTKQINTFTVMGSK